MPEDRPPGGDSNPPQTFYCAQPSPEFMALLNRMTSRFDFDRDEAMELADASFRKPLAEYPRAQSPRVPARPTQKADDSPPTSP